MPCKGIRIENSGIPNPGLWNLEYSSRKDWNFYHLSWKTVFNFKQNAVSYSVSIIVNVIANQTRRWRHLWRYTEGPASEHPIKWIRCVVGENPTPRYHLKKEKNKKNFTLSEYIFDEQGGMIDSVILTRQK